MGLKRAIRKVAKFIVASQPTKMVKVEVSQISYGGIMENKTAVITGGGSGLGLAIAKKLVSEGAKVVISGRNEKKLKNACKNMGEKAQYIVFDVCEVDKATDFIVECEQKLGTKIDFLVSNAGLSLHENIFTNVTVDGFDRQFNTNYRGNYFLCKAFLEKKLEEENPLGELLVITSESADQAYDIPYGMTKAGLNSMIRAMSRRVYKSGIRVNGIAPGVTQSDMTKEYADVSDGNMYRDCASDRVFKPEEVAEVACFILSDAAKCISGEIIHTNGGNHIKAFWDKSDDK
ncbi:SDR family NAD(P)-dependent oxidoreductase [Lactobacillus delbrueckii]|uniref:SDR family NAD(P)-dependent oxidoreductase n=1 Tax=Lactobacillus delbrueckii TaxID=1584 RepID=UPI000739603B|nr:SDR family oxidoreductase [Lactobacillus delbrueckii]CUS16841.1 Dehydrogenases with different specificities (related to short-chain alcohol dehydrogenases) [Lactobacillus delbrueckii subsp. bulgaricus]